MWQYLKPIASQVGTSWQNGVSPDGQISPLVRAAAGRPSSGGSAVATIWASGGQRLC
jgi:hypothetical protein